MDFGQFRSVFIWSKRLQERGVGHLPPYRGASVPNYWPTFWPNL